jgi:NADPH-dependent 2,4-dienoyl-CoA reductase/sulfur reductase-like enzyme
MSRSSHPIQAQYELVVVGAGPAGLAAAAQATKSGVSTLLIDEQPRPGGQIYRSITASPVGNKRILGPDYWRGAALVHEWNESAGAYLPGNAVWNLSPDLEIGTKGPEGLRLIKAEKVILATGALERPFPIPGWTMPGVMTVGAAQTLLKSSGLVAHTEAVIAGTGPLLWLLAAQYLEAGAEIAAILDTTPRSNRSAAWPHSFSFLTSSYFKKGLDLMRRVKRRVPIHREVTDLRAEGTDRIREVRFRSAGGEVRSLKTDALLLHQGLAPNINLSQAIGCRLRWDDVLRCFYPETDRWGRSSVANVWIAGDGGGITGAEASEMRGRLAALDVAAALGKIDAGARDQLAFPVRNRLAAAMRGRAFLDRWFRPSAESATIAADTIVCRCEEVTAGQIRDAVVQGARGPNQLKTFTRCGMGPCQGRLCGLTVTELIAASLGETPDRVGYYRLRPPIKPITLAELASLEKPEAAVQAVERF